MQSRNLLLWLAVALISALPATALSEPDKPDTSSSRQDSKSAAAGAASAAEHDFLAKAAAALKAVQAAVKDDKILGPLTKAKINQDQGSLSIRTDTPESWPNFPAKPQNLARGNGWLKIDVYRELTKDLPSTPFIPPPNCYYRSTYLFVPGTQAKILLDTTTGDPNAQDRLVDVIVKELGTAGITASRAVRIGDVDYGIRIIGPGIGRSENGRKWCIWDETSKEAWMIDPLRPALDDHFRSTWPLITVSADRKWAAVVGPGTPPKKPLQYVMGIVDLAQGQIVATTDSGDSPGPFAFSPDGRYAYPLRGSGAEFFYFDLKNRKAVHQALLDPPPKPGEGPYWSGVVLDGKTLHVVVRDGRFSRDRRLAHFVLSLDAPEEGKFQVDHDRVDSIYGSRGDELLVSLDDRTLAILSAKTWSITRKIEDPFQQQLLAAMFRPSLISSSTAIDVSRMNMDLHVLATESRGIPTLSPDGNSLYWIDSHKGTTIFDVKTGKVLGKAPEPDGLYWNAASIGPTFSADGKLAVVATPYEDRVTVIDTRTLAPVARIMLRSGDRHPPAGAFFIAPSRPGEPGTCLVVTGYPLPYE